MVANLGVELAHKSMFICELKRTTEKEKKNSNLIRKEKLTLKLIFPYVLKLYRNFKRRNGKKVESCWQFS